MLEQLQAQWTKPWVTAWPIFSAIYGKTACHTCHSLHAIYGWMLESSGIHVYMTVFPCEIWVMGMGWLPWLLWTRQGRGCGGRGCGGSGETCLPLAATRVARVWLQWDCMTCPGRSRGGWTAQQDNEVPQASLTHVPDTAGWSRSVFPMVLFWVLAPNYKSCGHEVPVTFSSADQLPLPCIAC